MDRDVPAVAACTERPRTGSRPDFIQVKSVNSGVATVQPIVVREGPMVRLLFCPVLVENDRDDAASVKGTFIISTQEQSGTWQSVPNINLNQLRAGEGVRLELKSHELLYLHERLSALYKHFAEFGIRQGTHEYTLIDAATGVNRQLIDALSAASGADISTVLDWVTIQDPALIAAHFGTREKTLLHLDNVLGIARLEAFIAKADELLRSNAEGQWQDFLRDESWAIAQLYAEPLVILNNQPYVGGKGVANRGGSVCRFSLRE